MKSCCHSQWTCSLCFYFHKFQENKNDKHDLVTKKKFHWAIISIHMDTTCGLTHVNQKPKPWSNFFHCTCIMYAFGVLNSRTHYHVTELHLGVQAFLKCQPSLEISHDRWWVPTWFHRKKKLKRILSRYLHSVKALHSRLYGIQA